MPRPVKKYSYEQLQEAVKKVMAGEISQKKASTFYGIPVMTISDHVHGKSKSSKPGPLPVMSPALEVDFSKKLMDLADRGFGLTKQLVLQKAAKLCRLAQLPHPFKEGPTGDSWYRAFMRRNPALTLRTPSRLSTARGRAMNRAVVGDYFQDVAKYTEGLQPISIWNMDESGFHFEHQPIKVVCKKGVRAINSRVSSSRENVTVVACASAAGVVMPPMFVVKGKPYKSLHSFNTVKAPPKNHSIVCYDQLHLDNLRIKAYQRRSRISACRRAFYALRGAGQCKHAYMHTCQNAMDLVKKYQTKLLKAALSPKIFCRNTPLLQDINIKRISQMVSPNQKDILVFYEE
ncbi:hypothetical protein LSH36_427g02030 [Paralvinella palmiformis]|uniref:HTH psq-type domain-containing protein n=1 Tax=Paralvinella palmiformis TaxID=53620 RepID=A0AAD9JBH6_9ANNE|nr:hypothetical protein LSH36_427g02030 [Paralvinella palmiformis]